MAPLASDIDQIGTVCDDEADADERERCAAIYRCGDGVWRPDRSIDEGRDCLRHRNAYDKDQREAEHRCGQNGRHGDHD
jgi:hypothetical protein